MHTGYGQSCRGYYLLTWLGYPRVHALNGGFSAWKAAGLPGTTEILQATPRPYPTHLPTADVMLSREDVQAALGTEKVLLDVRYIDVKGARASPRSPPRAGFMRLAGSILERLCTSKCR